MIVYHGSTKIIENPQIGFSKKYLDFGEGFYVTTFQGQAEKWAKRKALRHGGKAFVNVYDMSESFEPLKGLNFDSADEKWLDFVCACRRGENLNQAFDIIYGNVADDDVFKTIDMYFRGLWDKEKTLAELRYFQQNNQICFVTQQAIDSLLKFNRSYEVKVDG